MLGGGVVVFSGRVSCCVLFVISVICPSMYLQGRPLGPRYGVRVCP